MVEDYLNGPPKLTLSPETNTTYTLLQRSRRCRRRYYHDRCSLINNEMRRQEVKKSRYQETEDEKGEDEERRWNSVLSIWIRKEHKTVGLVTLYDDGIHFHHFYQNDNEIPTVKHAIARTWSILSMRRLRWLSLCFIRSFALPLHM